MAEMMILTVPTAPVAGTNEQQTITRTGTPTAGQWRLKYRNERTAPLSFDATATQIRDALRALNEVQADGVSGVTGGPVQTTAAVVTFAGHLGVANVAQMTVENISLVGGSYAVTTNVAGVDATLRGRGKGTVVVAEDTGEMYINKGTASAPAWKLVTTAA
jgi:hypothetical protein